MLGRNFSQDRHLPPKVFSSRTPNPLSVTKTHAFLEMTPNITLRAVKNRRPEETVIVSPAWVSPVGEDGTGHSVGAQAGVRGLLAPHPDVSQTGRQPQNQSPTGTPPSSPKGPERLAADAGTYESSVSIPRPPDTCGLCVTPRQAFRPPQTGEMKMLLKRGAPSGCS